MTDRLLALCLTFALSACAGPMSEPEPELTAGESELKAVGADIDPGSL